MARDEARVRAREEAHVLARLSLAAMWLLRLLPAWLFDRAFERAPRKPRGLAKGPSR